ncbi:glycosyltransferase family 2 protein [Dysosmobacter sp.]|uniref:glycosyltransferase family 2 protein n=1 Tax=Dysosmobacter sp. TaxID=2591382 RepID=UPI002A95284C|nr:glycosyltransferase family 2 protein [Dysosmobacter sp.]MDY5612252.1 glycosyltransferase family 2 protein [Dysosmobacter sp.]
MLVTIIVPCYNEEAALPYFLEAIQKTEAEMTAAYGCGFELLFVNDGSKDGTLSVLRRFAKETPNVRYLSFSRNFGKEAAMYAGLREAKGDYVAIMDADLQHPPAMLPEMYEGLQSGEYDCVAARRESRKGEPPIRSFFARCFYKIINRISDTEIVDGACDFRMMTRQMVDAIVSMGEYNRFSKGIFGWVGFRTKWLPYENVERVAGETKWSFWKLLLYSLQGIVGFSTVPLAIASVLGILLCFVSFLMVVYIIVKTLLFGDPVSGWPSLACMVMFMGGIQLLCMGILGQYLAKTYLETKHRPIYILAETDKENPDGTKTD